MIIMIYLKMNQNLNLIFLNKKMTQIYNIFIMEYFTRHIFPSNSCDIMIEISFPAFKKITNDNVAKYQNNDNYFHFIMDKNIQFAEDFDINIINPENNKYLHFLHGYYYLLKKNNEFALIYLKKSLELGYKIEILTYIEKNDNFIEYLLMR
jgi:hypothetical protein